MRLKGAGYELLDEREILAIVDFMLDVLDQVGMRIENEPLCRHLADSGAAWDGEFGVCFPRKLMEDYVARQRLPEEPEPRVDGQTPYTGTIGGYPLRWLDPRDSKIKPHTLRSTADLTRLADFLPGITSIGSVGVPGDVPPLLRVFLMRLVSWRYAEGKPSNTYVVWDNALCGYIVEFCQAASEMERGEGAAARWLRAGNYLVSPLRYPREPAAQFEWFWKHGYRFFVGTLPSLGGTVPVTIAGGVGVAMAETLALNFIQHVFFGEEGLHLATAMAPLDMRSGYMPYGRPEQLLAGLAVRQVCGYLGTLDDPALSTSCSAKEADIECGLSKGLAAGVQLGVLDRLRWSFGLISTDEVVDPRMMVVENEFVEGVKRLARGVEVSADTLPLDAVKEVGPGGQFLSHRHTLENFRKETWLPEFSSGESLGSWTASGSVPILEKARRRVLEILETHHPRGIGGETEEALLDLVDRFARELGVDDYSRPEIPV